MSTATVDASVPPAYIDTNVDSPFHDRPILRHTLSQQTRLKEFTYDIRRKGHGNLKLTLDAQQRLSAHIATFVGDAPLTGSALLEIQKPSSAHEISIIVRGYFTRVGRPEQLIFLDLKEKLWDATMGAPKELSDLHLTDTKAISGEHPPTTKSSFQIDRGTYRWNFRVKLPREVTPPPRPGADQEAEDFRLPETFIERHSRGSINYDIAFEVKYSGLFASTSKCIAPFAFVPFIAPPEPFSSLRSLAYSEGTTLLGPDHDPQGWQALPAVAVSGTLFQARRVELECTVYLAKPLSYTRGSAIPVVLRLTSTDQEALDVLSAPEAVKLVLRRRITYDRRPLTTSEHPGGQPWQDDLETSSVASCWRDEVDGPLKDAQTRIVRAELALFTKLKPSSRLGGFGILYDIVLSAFAAPGFESDNKATLLEYPVEIVTAYLPGPRPILYRPPPAYDPAKADHTGFTILTIAEHPW